MAARPPIKTAQEAATKALVADHIDEWEGLVDAYLAEAGWGRRTVTKEVWRKDGATPE